MQKKFLEAGRITTTHALKGEVKIEQWCDDVSVILALKYLYVGKEHKKMKITSAKQFKNQAIIKFEGINSVEEANSLRAQIVYADRDDIKLPEGAYFIEDIIGVEVKDFNSKKTYGKICDVTATGANDVYHIKDDDGKLYLIPAIEQVIVKTDIEAGEMLITPMKGLFDDED